MQGMQNPDTSTETARSLAVWKLRARGMTLHQIGAELGWDYSTVSKVLKRTSASLLAEWKVEQQERHLQVDAQLEHLLGEAMRCWHASCGPNGTGQGEVKYLDAAVRILTRICRLWGLDAPKAIELTATGRGYSSESWTIFCEAFKWDHLPPVDPEPRRIEALEPVSPPAAEPEPVPATVQEQYSFADLVAAQQARAAALPREPANG
jgi:hypothetical protein